jgi:hypothetical protein
MGVVKQDDDWRIKYEFDGDPRMGTIQDMVSYIAGAVRSTREADNLLSEFLFRYLSSERSAGRYEVTHSPIYVEDGTLHVGFDKDLDAAFNPGMPGKFYDETTDQNASREFTGKVRKGSLYGIFREMFDGKRLQDAADEITRRNTPLGFISYGIDMVGELCDKYGVRRFPKYTNNDPNPKMPAADEFTILAEHAISEYGRISQKYKLGDAPHSDLTLDDVDVDDLDGAKIVWFTGNGYRKISRGLGLKHGTVTDLFNSYVENKRYRIHAVNKSHKFKGYPGRGFALWIRD